MKERLDPAASVVDIGRVHSVLEFIDLFDLERDLSPRYTGVGQFKCIALPESILKPIVGPEE